MRGETAKSAARASRTIVAHVDLICQPGKFAAGFRDLGFGQDGLRDGQAFFGIGRAFRAALEAREVALHRFSKANRPRAGRTMTPLRAKSFTVCTVSPEKARQGHRVDLRRYRVGLTRVSVRRPGFWRDGPIPTGETD